MPINIQHFAHFNQSFSNALPSRPLVANSSWPKYGLKNRPYKVDRMAKTEHYPFPFDMNCKNVFNRYKCGVEIASSSINTQFILAMLDTKSTHIVNLAKKNGNMLQKVV